MSLQDGSQAPAKGGKLFKVLTGGALLLLVLGAFTMLQRRSEYRMLAEETETLAIQTVGVIHPSAETGEEDLVLPGTMEAFVESPIYARTNGYLKKWYHDIGSRVQKGDLLADIDTPEVDQQLSQARADLATAQANSHLSEITASRYTELLKTDGVSKQEVDNAAGDLAAKRAIVQSADANVHRLEEMKSFQHIYAPFSGVITRRNVDIGTLINAGNTGSAEQLFFLAQTSPLRVYVRVPEIYANTIHAGLGAYLEVTQHPGQKIEGKVARTAEAIDLATRTLNTEVDVPNRDGALLPGGYAQVHLEVKVTASRLQVPVNALLFRSEGLRAVVVDANHKIHLRQITVGRDYGTSLEVLQGLDSKEWIVLNPEDSLEEGQEVRVKEIAMNAAGPAPAKPQAPTQGPNKQ
ncbi:MAG TPA: efflux RND transporter periplasmic adaptor subunit [Candidatus Acidoferrum sp.]|jgi:RND family efflux transporter MFP subunit|nr:efflux RND transporter periplasmic adaptor subunit [Candidatus Acidoferrum sp.]